MRPAHRTYGGVALASTLAALICTAWPTTAHAQGLPMEDGPMTGSSEVLIGLGISHGPAYLGSDEHRTRALPLLAARWSNGWFAGVAGAGYRLDLGGGLSGGLRVTLDMGRDENDAAALAGLGDIEARPELGAFANWRPIPGLVLGTSVRAGSGNDRDGVLVDFSLRGGLPVSANVRLTASLAATLANTKAMQSQFGVDAAQSARSGYAVYTPASGLRDVSLQLGSAINLQRDTLLVVGVQSRTLMGDAKDSPITRERTGVGLFATVAMRL